MKLRLLALLTEKLLGTTADPDSPRADLYLPLRLLAIALVFLALGTGLALAFFWSKGLWMILAGIFCIAMGATALLCYKNQSIQMISQEKFIYTTFLGNRYEFSFSQIQGLRKNQDSMTLFVAGKKVHIESMAVISPRLANAINRELDRIYAPK